MLLAQIWLIMCCKYMQIFLLKLLQWKNQWKDFKLQISYVLQNPKKFFKTNYYLLWQVFKVDIANLITDLYVTELFWLNNADFRNKSILANNYKNNIEKSYFFTKYSRWSLAINKQIWYNNLLATKMCFEVALTPKFIL